MHINEEYYLDEKDQLIIENLFRNARLSSHQLSKIAGITQPAVYNRIKRLEKEGYISRYDSLVNWQALPFIKKIYFCDLKNDEIRSISKRNECFGLIELYGEISHMVWCFFKTKRQMIEFERLLPIKKETVEIKNLFTTGVSLFNESSKKISPTIKFDKVKLTKKDVKVMHALSEGGARKSLKEISEMTGLNIDQVWYHKKRLIKGGYFEYFIVQPGIEKFYLIMSTLFVKTNKKVRLDNLPRVFNHFDTDKGVGCVFMSKNMKDYLETLDKIYSMLRGDIKEVLLSSNKNYIILNRYPFEFLTE